MALSCWMSLRGTVKPDAVASSADCNCTVGGAGPGFSCAGGDLGMGAAFIAHWSLTSTHKCLLQTIQGQHRVRHVLQWKKIVWQFPKLSRLLQWSPTTFVRRAGFFWTGGRGPDTKWKKKNHINIWCFFYQSITAIHGVAITVLIFLWPLLFNTWST